MPDLGKYFRTAPASEFSGTVYRICPYRYGGNLVSMRRSFLHGARYNIRGYFGTLYTSLSKETARREMAKYFTVAPRDGFVEASILMRLSRVLDLTNTRLLRHAGIARAELIGTRCLITREIGLRAWENGIEALLAPSAAHPAGCNLAVFLDNQRPLWKIALTRITAGEV
ncbi:MAG TPA: RES family NAD+ phosphorylase [Bryobacteraceae bacterium]|nr:RES family NAD+ phosphorylase [Bryobacteraceae bacterium]